MTFTYECPRCDSLMPGECCEVHCNCAKHSHSEARAALFAAWRLLAATENATRISMLALRARAERAEVALRKAEWGAPTIAGASCPVCHRLRTGTYEEREHGHAADCCLAAALSGPGGAP